MRQEAYRVAPAERAARYVDNWREVYSVPRQEAISVLVKNGSTLIVGAIFAAMFFRDVRCFLLIVIVGVVGTTRQLALDHRARHHLQRRWFHRRVRFLPLAAGRAVLPLE